MEGVEYLSGRMSIGPCDAVLYSGICSPGGATVDEPTQGRGEVPCYTWANAVLHEGEARCLAEADKRVQVLLEKLSAALDMSKFGGTGVVWRVLGKVSYSSYGV